MFKQSKGGSNSIPLFDANKQTPGAADLVGRLASHGERHRLLLKQGMCERRQVAGHLNEHGLAQVDGLGDGMINLLICTRYCSDCGLQGSSSFNELMSWLNSGSFNK